MIDALRSGSDPGRKLSQEEDTIRKLILAGLAVEFVPLDEPDIMCTLPEEAVRRAWPDARFDGGWSAVKQAWSELEGPVPRGGFKKFALEDQLGLSCNDGDFIEATLFALTGADSPAQSLVAALERASGFVTAARQG